jgi:N-acetylneuraminic acid mutarotase
MRSKKYYIIVTLSLVLIQNLLADGWYTAPPLLQSRGGASAVSFDKYIYVFGGKSYNNKVLNNVERFDLNERTWDTTHVPDFTYPRYNATAVVFEGKIYLMGGQDGESTLKVVEVYDPVQNEWSEVQNLRREREALAGAVFNDRIYAIGGQKETQSLIDEIEWYDKPADDWLDAIFDLPYPRAAHFYSVIGNTFYMFGGYYYGPTKTAYKAIPGANGYEWIQLDDLEMGRAYGAATVSHGDIYIIGGETSAGKTNSIEVLLPENETYGDCEPISSPRSGIAAVTVDDTIIYVIGGFETEYNDPVTTVEWYKDQLYTHIDDRSTQVTIPEDHIIISGYPNPFNNGIKLEIGVPQNDQYEMTIYNVSGQKIATLFNGNLTKGTHAYQWQVESNLASGLYFLVVNSRKYFQKYKMVYVK